MSRQTQLCIKVLTINEETKSAALKSLQLTQEGGHNLRPQSNQIFNDSSRLKISQLSFNVDAARLWKQAPTTVTLAPTISTAN